MEFNDGPGVALERLLRIIEEAFPIPGRFRSALPGDTAELSRLLTSARPEREGGYLSRPNLLSAYLRYFLPWNVFRLYRLFSFVPGEDEAGFGEADLPGKISLPEGVGPSKGPALSFLGLRGGDAVTDLGSGPLTLPVALWLFRPELRKLDLEFRCVDQSASVLEAGKKLFAALEAAEGRSFWKIRTIHDSVNAPVRGEKAALVTAINVFNEMYQRDDPAFAAEKAARILDRSGSGSILVMEPGVPKSGAFIAALRNVLLEQGKRIAAPCIHEGLCPLSGAVGESRRGTGARFPESGRSGSRIVGSRAKAKWCHFAFDTADAPVELHRLSAAAGIPKERAVFSFLLADKIGTGKLRLEAPRAGTSKFLGINPLANQSTVRVISDAFPVSGGWGRYGCGENGLVLLKGSRAEVERVAAGIVVEAAKSAEPEFDGKTGALIVNLTERRGLG
jgi:hypothetical protein